QFAHDTPVLRLVWSADGHTLASAGEDRLVKIWNAEAMTIRQTLERQPDWASGLAISADGRTLVVGRIDGSIRVYNLPPASVESETRLVPSAEVPPEIDYGPQPAIDKLPKVAEVEPNDEPEQAAAIPTPGVATGKVTGTLRVPSTGNGRR